MDNGTPRIGAENEIPAEHGRLGRRAGNRARTSQVGQPD
jgi:hypothetical protein